MDNVTQNHVMTFKMSLTLRERLERLSKSDGITNAAFLRGLINKEYKTVFGEVE